MTRKKQNSPRRHEEIVPVGKDEAMRILNICLTFYAI